MRVLVTGGAGFIGSHTVDLLLSANYDVIILDDFSTGLSENILHHEGSPHLHVIRGSICDKNLVDKVMEKVDAVIHLAAIVSVVEAREDPQKAFKVNCEGTLILLDAAKRHNVKRFVYASSAAVYGNPLYLPLDEKHPCRPLSIYGATKLCGESLTLAYAEEHGLSAIALRYMNVYGPRMRRGDYAGVIASFIENALRGEPLIIYGDGTQTRDFVFVKDVAKANLAALNSDFTGVVNIGTGTATSILELAKEVTSILGVELSLIYRPPRPGDIKHSQASIERARKVLGWEPKVSLREGLIETINWFKLKIRKEGLRL